MTSLANEYAEALFLLAAETGRETAFRAELSRIAPYFTEEYLAYLSSPAVPLTERTEAIRRAFGGAVSGEVLSFLCLLCEKGRMGIFHEALAEYEKLEDKSRRVTAARVTSALPLSEGEKARLVAKLEGISGKRVTASYETDPALLGGVVVEMDGTTYDGSLRFRLQDVKDEISR